MGGVLYSGCKSGAEKQHGGFLGEQLAAQEQKERVVSASFACL